MEFSSAVTFCSAHFPRRVFLFTGFTISLCKGSEDHGLEHLSRSEIPAFIGVSVLDQPCPRRPVWTLEQL